jgi:hypothetical protein
LKYLSLPFAPHDKVAAGDITGDGYDEIILSDDDGNQIEVYNYNGERLCGFSAPRNLYDGLAAADIDGDGKAEIISLTNKDDTIWIYKGSGFFIKKIELPWDFKGTRETGPDTRHDAFMVGDVMADSKPEIVILENTGLGVCNVRIYSFETEDYMPGYPKPLSQFSSFGCIFTDYDAACLGDITGDSKLELLIATDEAQQSNGLQIKVYDLQNGELAMVYLWPIFTLYDGFVAGNLMNRDKDQLIIVEDDENTVSISLS